MLEGEENSLVGELRINEVGVGIATYGIKGTFEAPTLRLLGTPTVIIEGFEFGELTAIGQMTANGEIKGNWETSLGAGGPFHLFPHAEDEPLPEGQTAEQLHSARYSFGAIAIDRDQITEIANNIEREFPSPIVTIVDGTERSFYLKNFIKSTFSSERAESIRILARKPDRFGLDQTITIEFGPYINFAMTQGTNEAWVLGQLETIKRELKRYERPYFTNFKKFGVNIASVVAIIAVAFLPNLDQFKDRLIFCGALVGLFYAVKLAHMRFMPHAIINLRARKRSVFEKIWPVALSWILGIAATIIASLFGAYLEGALEIGNGLKSPAQIDKPR